MSRPRAEMRVERLPFTVYDVLGYLVPGAFALWTTFVFAKSIKSSFGLNSAQFDIVGVAPQGVYVSLFIFLVSSYVAGHLLGLLSSITVEKLAIEYFGYPSKFLTLKTHDDCLKVIENNIKSDSFRRCRVSLAKYVCWPVWLSTRFLIWTELFSIFMKPFPEAVCIRLKTKLDELNLNTDNFENCLWWKGAEFYVINNIPHAFARMYNYLTIFGFFRNFCFIFVAVTWVYFAKLVIGLSPAPFSSASNLYAWLVSNWQGDGLIGLIGSASLSLFFYLGFLKFFRRYSEEAILALCYFENPPADD